MTTYSAVLPTFVATTAGLKDVMNSISTLMTNSGWALAADTGQMDISAVTYSATSGTVYGYKIWYFNDSQHGTFPIYMRQYWKMNASSSLAIYWTIGAATDGAGAITGYKAGGDTTLLYSGTVASGAWGVATNPSKACSLDGYGFWNLAPVSYQAGPLFLLSRDWNDTTGAVDTNGSFFFIVGNTTAPYMMSMNIASAHYATSAYFCLSPQGRTSSQVANTTDLFLHYMSFPTAFKKSNVSLTYHAGDISAYQTFSAQPLTGGSARTYLTTPNENFANTSSTDRLAVLWE